MIWRCSRFEFDAKMPIVMGILNVTPDSFSDGGTHADHDEAVAHALCMVEEGAQIVDVGGESTRPGAEPVSVEEEKARTIDVVRALAERGLCVSIDTRHAEVARAAVEAGAEHRRTTSPDSATLPWWTWRARAMRGSWSCTCRESPAPCRRTRRTTTWSWRCATTWSGRPRCWSRRASRATASASIPARDSARRRSRRWSWCATCTSSCARATRSWRRCRARATSATRTTSTTRRSATARRRPKRSWRASWGRASCARTMWPRPCRRSRTCGLSCCWGWVATWPWSLAREKSRKQRRRS